MAVKYSPARLTTAAPANKYLAHAQGDSRHEARDACARPGCAFRRRGWGPAGAPFGGWQGGLGGKGVWAPIWVLDWANPKYVDKSVEVPFTPAALEKFQQRRANNSKDDPEGYCLPPGVPRYTGTPYPFQMIQLPDRLVILYEGASHMYRTVVLWTGASTHPEEKLNPTWLGESIG